jgi:hypothetical protein
MYSGISELFHYRSTYCYLVVLYNECKWWQFSIKRDIKKQLNWTYPLMKNEQTGLNQTK